MITAYQARTTVEANIMRLQDDLERCLDAIKQNVTDNKFNVNVTFDSKTNANTVKKKLKELGYRIVIRQNNTFYTPTFTVEIYW